MRTHDSLVAETLAKSNPQGFNQYTGKGAKSPSEHAQAARAHGKAAATAKSPHVKRAHEAAQLAHLDAASHGRGVLGMQGNYYSGVAESATQHALKVEREA